MAVNKVVLGEDTLIDLTGDTVSADKLSKGVTAHNMAGEPIVGTMEAGGGKEYTFTNGLTETNGTVSWDLNDRIKKGSDNTSNNTSVVLNTDDTNAVSTDKHTANGNYATAVGRFTKADGNGSFAEGYTDQGWLTAGGTGSHVEGHAEGYYGMTVFSNGAHGEGYTFNRTRSIYGVGSHAEGADTLTNGYACHAEGNFTDALSSTQHVQGKYNIKDSNGVFQDIVGNGSADESRSNASALDWNGNLYISGKIYQDCTDYSTNSSGLVTPRCGGTPVGGGGSSYTAGDGITIDSSNVISNNFGKSITCSWLALDDEFNWGYGDYIKEVAATESMFQYLGKCPVIAGASVYTPDLSLFTDDWTTGRKTLYKYDGTNFTFTSTRTDGTYYLAHGHVLAKVGRQNWIDCSSMAIFRKYLSRIKYDNTNSGLTATNIPDAIDELNTKITTVEANPENPTQTLSSIKIGDVDYSVGGGASNIPAPPSTDGEYNLHCSIINGVPTYTWKAE